MESTVFCQGCLSTENLLLLSQNDYKQKFEKCFNIKVGFETSQLEWICKRCIQHLNDASEFRNLVEITRKYLEENFTDWYRKIDTELSIKSEDFKNETQIDQDMGWLDVDTEPCEFVKSETEIEPEDKKEVNVLKDNDKSDAAIKLKPRKCKKKSPIKPQIVKKQNTICKICSQEFANECSLSVHKVNEHAIRANVPEFAAMLVCSYCNLAFTELDEFNQHLIGQHEANEHKVKWDTRNFVPCKICGFHFRDYSVRSYHVQNAHKLKDIPQDMLEKCSECEERFENYLEQVTHMYESHKKELPVPLGCFLLNCEPCGFAFSKLSLYLKHMSIVHKVQPINRIRKRCQFCRLFFKLKADLDEHTPVHADIAKRKRKMPEYRYKCSKCGEHFKYKSERKKHLADVHNIREGYPCEFCGLKIASMTGLRRHRRIHTKEVVAICDHCGYSTKDKCTLTVHLTKHVDVRPFSCKICGKPFKTKAQIDQHAKIHFEKQFSCHLCGVRFTHKSNVKSHMTRNHKQHFITDKLQFASEFS